MPLLLKDNWAIVVDPDGYYLVNTEYPRKTWFALDRWHCHVLSMLDGSATRGSIASGLSEACGMPVESARALAEATITRYRQCITDKGRSVAGPPAIYRQHDRLAPTEAQKVRNCAPMRLTWVATTRCAKQCKYCYMDAKQAPPDAEARLPEGRMRAIAREAADLAVSEMLITGGEPFLSPDVYDAINDFTENGVRVVAITKSLVDCGRLSARAKRSLMVEFSLDSADESVVRYMTGCRESFDEAIRCMEGMARAGVPFRIKMVAGRANSSSVRQMARLCKDLGGKALQVAEYRPSMGRNIKDFSLDDGIRSQLVSDTLAAEEEYGVPIHLDLFQNEFKHVSAPGHHCSEGIKTLSFLPDGACTRCPSLPYNRRLTAGNVIMNGIYDSWNNNRRYESLVFMGKGKYKNTDCHGCGLFNWCNLTGRCIIKSYLLNGSYYGPDRICPDRIPGTNTIGGGERNAPDKE